MIRFHWVTSTVCLAYSAICEDTLTAWMGRVGIAPHFLCQHARGMPYVTVMGRYLSHCPKPGVSAFRFQRDAIAWPRTVAAGAPV